MGLIRQWLGPGSKQHCHNGYWVSTATTPRTKHFCWHTQDWKVCLPTTTHTENFQKEGKKKKKGKQITLTTSLIPTPTIISTPTPPKAQHTHNTHWSHSKPSKLPKPTWHTITFWPSARQYTSLTRTFPSLTRISPSLTRISPSLTRIAPSLTRISPAQDFHRRGHLLFANSFVLLFLCGSFQALPGQISQVEIHHHVAQRLKVISATLLCVEKGEGKIYDLSNAATMHVWSAYQCSRSPQEQPTIP